MASEQNDQRGPDLRQGIAIAEMPGNGMLAGHVGDDEVLLVRKDGAFFAIGRHCSHYHAPLEQGLVHGFEVRCPWHHAGFDLRTGEATRAPALNALPCWSVEEAAGKVFVRERRDVPSARRPAPAGEQPQRIVIVGGGAAGFAAAEMLRRQGYGDSLVMLSEDADAPVDRPNLSKDYLAGNAPEDWVPLRSDDFYRENGIELRLSTRVEAIDPAARTVALADGGAVPYDRLLLATGAEPVRPPIPGIDLPHVHTLRSFADCRAIVAAAATTRTAVVLGASFIGLEVAASLRARGLAVHVVAPEPRPMERILGAEFGDLVRGLHESHGVVFHLEKLAASIAAQRVTLKDGNVLEADLVVAGTGVRPRIALAERAGLRCDDGVLVDAHLETSAPGIYAAGDIARWPDPRAGEPIRVEHWVVAERQGQTAALNMLGHRQAFDAVPFFWSQHYDVPINYVGHGRGWDALEIEGSIADKDCLVRYKRGGRVVAVASIFRDVENLQAEIALERAAA
ncbi:MAG: pyridine nucleotide-disulfide oxidoreductase [Alphaproteobacteria bacterium]|nr:MAG: pyridine nucleotide-disulfide oxidoreductase [Alphaproteobacteria bacterium]